MSLPKPVLQQVQETLETSVGRAVQVVSSRSVGGGCVNAGTRLETDEGSAFFLKWNPASSPDMFEAEADGLRGLESPGILRVPEVIGWGGEGTSEAPAWLLMEFIPRGSPGPDYGRRLGRGLARLHEAGTGESFGWRRDNFIGPLPQANPASVSWIDFWRDQRLMPQLELAREKGHFQGEGGRLLDSLLGRLDQVMEGTGQQSPALLHGDLWSGNYYPDSTGNPVLIDPATYLGVGEVDLAMMELFGSFPVGFQEEYAHHRGWAEEYESFRRALYQLYSLLVHVNLCGAGYRSGTLAAARQALTGL